MSDHGVFEAQITFITYSISFLIILMNLWSQAYPKASRYQLKPPSITFYCFTSRGEATVVYECIFYRYIHRLLLSVLRSVDPST
jgi:hypothetical protein